MEKEISIGIGAISILSLILLYYYRKKLNKFKNLKKYGLIGIFLVSVASNAGFSPAGPILDVAAGAIYNPLLVGTVAAAGSLVADAPLYFIGNSTKPFHADNAKWYEIIQKYMNQNGFLTIFLMALIPNPFFDIAAFIAGSTKYPYWLFATASFLGKALKCTFYAFLGKHFIHLK